MCICFYLSPCPYKVSVSALSNISYPGLFLKTTSNSTASWFQMLKNWPHLKKFFLCNYYCLSIKKDLNSAAPWQEFIHGPGDAFLGKSSGFQFNLAAADISLYLGLKHCGIQIIFQLYQYLCIDVDLKSSTIMQQPLDYLGIVILPQPYSFWITLCIAISNWS